MRTHNARLQAARERLASRLVPGASLSRAELAELVNAWLWKQTGQRFELDDHLIGKWERGVVRCPSTPYRAALRAVLSVRTDQLADVCERLRTAPTAAITNRMFLAAAELAKIAGSMAFDAGDHRSAQRHYVTAARLAKAGDHLSFGAVALAALARQSFDLGASDDGLQIVQLSRALDLREVKRARNRALDLVSLGRAHLLTGAADAAASSVNAALPFLDRRTPGRLGRKLADWCAEAAPFATATSVTATRAAVREAISSRLSTERMP